MSHDTLSGGSNQYVKALLYFETADGDDEPTWHANVQRCHRTLADPTDVGWIVDHPNLVWRDPDLADEAVPESLGDRQRAVCRSKTPAQEASSEALQDTIGKSVSKNGYNVVSFSGNPSSMRVPGRAERQTCHDVETGHEAEHDIGMYPSNQCA